MTKLKDLLEAWDIILERMDIYGRPILGNNEEATRYALIDPILVGLGWNIHHPEHVRVQCSQEYGGIPDYALMKDNEAICFVEAKKWGTISRIRKKYTNPLDSEELDQLSNYCLFNKVDTGALSDGGSWYIIDYSKKNPKILSFIDAAVAERKDVKKLLYISR